MNVPADRRWRAHSYLRRVLGFRSFFQPEPKLGEVAFHPITGWLTS
jgi:hypothetical protein